MTGSSLGFRADEDQEVVYDELLQKPWFAATVRIAKRST